MTIIEQIKAEIERLKENILSKVHHYPIHRIELLDDLLAFLNTLEEPVSEALEEAKHAFSEERFPDEKMAPLRRAARIGYEAGAKWQEEKDQETIKLAEDHAFLAGSDWQKKQMMKEAVEGWVAVDSDTSGKRRVTFFSRKPVRDVLTEYKYWAATRPGYESIKLDSNAFPELKWEDEPKKVRIIIVKED